jgi:hypothetical protein
MSITDAYGFQALKTESDAWNLAVDDRLLKALSKFSISIAEKTQKCIQNVDDLGYEVADSEVSLKNTFNEFLLLGNTQFIENVSDFLALRGDQCPV